MASGDLPFKSYPNEYTNPNVTSTGVAVVSFGFPAGLVRVSVLTGPSVRVRFKSSAAGDLATTAAGYLLSTGDAVPLELRGLGVGISGLSLCATSTASIVNVGAWG